jgi:transposase
MSEKTQQLQVPAEDSMPVWRELTSVEWARIEPIILASAQRPREWKRKISDRQIVDAILYIHHTKTAWKDLPAQFGSLSGVTKRISRWRKTGTYQQVYDELEAMGLIVKQPPIVESPIQEKVEKPLEWWELTDEQWGAVAHLLPEDSQIKKRNPNYKTNREILNALLYREFTDTSWSQLPGELGHWNTIFDRFSKWRDKGILQQVFSKLEELGALSVEKYARGRKSNLAEVEKPLEWWELTDEEWKQVVPLIPREGFKSCRGKKQTKTDREVLDILLYREYTKTPWRELPEEFGHWRTINDRYTKWREEGTLQKILFKLEELGALSVEKYARGRKSNSAEVEKPLEWWELTDEEWNRVAPLIPRESFKKGKKEYKKTDREILNILLYREYTKTAWEKLPKEFGRGATVFARYKKWRDEGTLQRVFEELSKIGCEKKPI